MITTTLYYFGVYWTGDTEPRAMFTDHGVAQRWAERYDVDYEIRPLNITIQ